MLKLLITRKLPDPVLSKARDVFDVTVRDNTAPLSREELLQSLTDYDVVLPTLGDAYSADIFAAVPEKRTKLLANFGVGYNHLSLIHI